MRWASCGQGSFCFRFLPGCFVSSGGLGGVLVLFCFDRPTCPLHQYIDILAHCANTINKQRMFGGSSWGPCLVEGVHQLFFSLC